MDLILDQPVTTTHKLTVWGTRGVTVNLVVAISSNELLRYEDVRPSRTFDVEYVVSGNKEFVVEVQAIGHEIVGALKLGNII